MGDYSKSDFSDKPEPPLYIIDDNGSVLGESDDLLDATSRADTLNEKLYQDVFVVSQEEYSDVV
jgi:hypothetical protein